MYVKNEINKLIRIIQEEDGIADKSKLTAIVQQKFGLIRDRSVYTGDYFSIRFSKSEKKRMSNTVLSLSVLQKYDHKPFFVCIVSSTKNYLLLANTTFLKKISHSSQELRIDNIKGSFNGSDILEYVNGVENSPRNFEELYAIHQGFSFQDNLDRLVESTNNIVGTKQKFLVTGSAKTNIINSVDRAICFVDSSEYHDLLTDLNERVEKVQGEIAIAAFIDNVNLRGRIIEYLITNDGSTLKDQIISALQNKQPLPQFRTDDRLGDYTKIYPDYHTETDIKTKVLFLDGNPKAYNIDKLLEFLSVDDSVYMIYLLGIGFDGEIVARLCSFLDKRLIEATNIIHHWAGRNSRGVAQFLGTSLSAILGQSIESHIDENSAKDFLTDLINR